MSTINLPNISPITTVDERTINNLIKQLQRLREAIRKELQDLEDNKADA